MVSAAVQKHNFRPVSSRAVGRRKAGSATNSLILSRFHTLFGENNCIKDVVLIDDTCGGGGFLAGTKKQQRGDIE